MVLITINTTISLMTIVTTMWTFYIIKLTIRARFVFKNKNSNNTNNDNNIQIHTHIPIFMCAYIRMYIYICTCVYMHSKIHVAEAWEGTERSTPTNFPMRMDFFRARPQRPVPQPRSKQHSKLLPRLAIFAAMTWSRSEDTIRIHDHY